MVKKMIIEQVDTIIVYTFIKMKMNKTMRIKEILEMIMKSRKIDFKDIIRKVMILLGIIIFWIIIVDIRRLIMIEEIEISQLRGNPWGKK